MLLSIQWINASISDLLRFEMHGVMFGAFHEEKANKFLHNEEGK